MDDFKELEINGVTYVSSKLTATEGFLLKTKLLKLLGPCLSDILEEIKDKSFSELLSLDEGQEAEELANEEFILKLAPVIASVISNFAHRLEPEFFVTTLKEVCEKAKNRMGQVSFDHEFAGDKMLNAYRVAGLVISHNFGFFFGTVGGKLKESPIAHGLMKKASQKSPQG